MYMMMREREKGRERERERERKRERERETHKHTQIDIHGNSAIVHLRPHMLDIVQTFKLMHLKSVVGLL